MPLLMLTIGILASIMVPSNTATSRALKWRMRCVRSRMWTFALQQMQINHQNCAYTHACVGGEGGKTEKQRKGEGGRERYRDTETKRHREMCDELHIL